MQYDDELSSFLSLTFLMFSFSLPNSALFSFFDLICKGCDNSSNETKETEEYLSTKVN